MAPTITRHQFTKNEHTTSYLTSGPANGPLLIFLHGWPGIAATWTRQLSAFAALGFRVAAPDMRGYGHSSVPPDPAAYRIEVLIQDALDLLHHLNRPEAIWIGHDWGSAVVWPLAEHHPEVCRAIINLAVPSHQLELGLGEMLKYINREIYPETEFPFGQWDYQVNYERNAAGPTAQFAANTPNSIKNIYVKGNPATYTSPAPQSLVTRDGGRFGGASQAPDVPLAKTVFDGDEPLFDEVVGAMERTGWAGATAYYLNHKANAAFAKKWVNSGVLDLPVLFIDAKFDVVCSGSLSRIDEPMRAHCRDLTETTVEAGHWLQLEKPTEVNAAIAKWLVMKVEDWWPGYWKSPLVVRPKRP